MTRKKVGFETVRALGLALPNVEEGTTYGLPALKVHGKTFVCLAGHPSAEPNTLAVRLDFDQRDELIESEPPFLLTQLVVLVLFVVIGIVAVSRFRNETLRTA